MQPNRGTDLARTEECPGRFEPQHRRRRPTNEEDAAVTGIRSVTNYLAIEGYDAFAAFGKGTGKGLPVKARRKNGKWSQMAPRTSPE